MKTTNQLVRTLATLIALASLTPLGNAAITYTWNQATVAANNWDVAGNWSDVGGTFPGSAVSDIVIFTNIGTASAAGTVNSVVDVNTTIASLSYGLATTTGAFHNTQIATGVTLTVTGLVDVGSNLVVGTTPVTMSGTGNFTTTGTASAFNVGVGLSQISTLILADGTNAITNATLNVGNSAHNNGGSCSISLGKGSNIINATTINLGIGKSAGTIKFASSTLGGLAMGGTSGGTSRANILMAQQQSGTGTSTASTLALTGHPVNILAGSLSLGEEAGNSGGNAATATVAFDNGTLDATSVSMGKYSSGTGANGATGSITVGGNAATTATLIVNSPTGPGGGSFLLGNSTATGAATTNGTGTLTINTNGIAQIFCSILKAHAVASTGTINMNGGTLVMGAVGSIVGTPAIPINALNLTNAQVHLNVNAVANSSNIVATTVTTVGTTVITVDSIVGYTGGTVTNTLLAYSNTDPFASLSLAPLPTGFTGTLSDDAGRIDLVITSGPISAVPVPIVWNGGSSVSNFWSDSANWNGTNLIASDTLIFDGTTRLANFNDTAAGTIYSNLTFNPGAGAFVLSGNSIALGGNVVNNSPSLQTVNLNLGINAPVTLDGGTGGMIIGGGISVSANTNQLTLLNTGILTNIFSPAAGAAGLVLNPNAGSAAWTILDNASSIAQTVTSGGVNILNGGTLNFGSLSSAPNLVFAAGWSSDNTLGNTTGVSLLNVTNGTLTLPVRLNTQNANINVAGGTLNIWNQLQLANSSLANVSALTVGGGTLDVLNSAGTTIGGGTLFLASRGTGTLNLNGGLIECATLDVSRNVVSGTVGTVFLNGGTLQIGNKVSTATSTANTTVGAATATFYFNGGILKPNSSTATVTFQGSTVPPVIPITSIVQAGGAIVSAASGRVLNFLEPLQHDTALGATLDGGLSKTGIGIMTLGAVNTYTGPTVISQGTLALASGASINNSASLVIAGNATNDVSAIAAYNLGTTTALNVTGSGASPSYLIGASGGTVSLGSHPITLTNDGVNPSLIVSQGTLSLNANSFIVNTPSPLPLGTYPIIQQTTGNVTSSGTSTATGSAVPVGTGLVGVISVSNGTVNLVIDTPPVAGPATYARTRGLQLNLRASNIATNASDPDGDAVTVVAVSPTSTNGAAISLINGFVSYTPAAVSPDVTDTFTYTVADVHGATATGTVTITILPDSNAATVNITHFATLPDGTAQIGFAGIPGRPYLIQATTNTMSPIIWTTIATNNAGTNGLFNYTDLDATNFPTRFYRTAQP